jgi:multicomponent Na+:H+ antiporter subunit A
VTSATAGGERTVDLGRGSSPRPSAPALLAVLAAAAGTAAVLVGHLAGGASLDLPWASTWDLRLSFRLDGLGALYGLLACGIGAAVFAYASAYLPLHLEHGRRSRREEARFFAWLVLFMVSMVGLATAQDLILLFVFWDLTAIASWGLIGFDREEAESRRAALMALLVTGVSAVLLLVGILVLRAAYGSFDLPTIVERAEPSGALALGGALIAVAALAKSAQVPLHFWLPRAMAAPTPVSAYLHSAAMVAAGVFLLSRVHPLLAHTAWLLDALLVIGFASMAVGGLLALGGDELKQVLAHSTISQYGYVVVLLGIGGAAGAAGACFYVLAHALCKSALFLTAGAITEATGEKRLSGLGGLARRMPLLAAASGAAAAGLAALPLTIGFFKDELFFKAALERGPLVAALAVAGAALTFAYIARFWTRAFLGDLRAAPQPIPARLTLPVAGLSVLTVVGGLLVEPFAGLAEAAGEATAAGPAPVEAAYHLDARAENLMALGAWAGGLALLGLLPRLGGALRALAELGRRAGPERAYTAGLHAMNALSDRAHDLEVRDLRVRIAAVLVPSGLLVVGGLLATPLGGTYAPGAVATADLPLVLALVVCAIAALAVCRVRRHTALVLTLSGVGFALAVAYALFGAPDVALVAVLIETIFALLFLGVFSLLPDDVLLREAALESTGSRRWRDPLVGCISGLVAFLVVWGAFSRDQPDDGMAERHLELAEAAHGKDVVTVILADFRGLDTLVEITVVAVAVLGVTTLLRERARW